MGLTMEEHGGYYSFQSSLPPGEYFELRPRHMPHNSKPIVDDESGMCIGYSVTKKYTLEVIVREKDWTITHFLYK